MIKNMYFIGFVTVLLLQGCMANKYYNNKTVSNGAPKWLLDPYIDGDTNAAVGCAKRHFKGVEAQKKLAISRAIDQVATQNKVTVNNITLRKKSSKNGYRGNSSSNSSSLQSVDNVSISTKTKAIYKKRDGEICAWVILR